MNARIRDASDPDALAEAVARLRDGGLVAFPTETVYGLGAYALDETAVARIFAAKGRPATNPLIVHIAGIAAARALARAWPPIAQTLADRFWPGPLTLVVEKNDAVPAIVTANGPTVGLRVPNHPAALALLRGAGVPVAAPSANRSEEVSPTTAQHVADSLGPFVDDLLILDGGPCAVGIESAVLDVTTNPPRVLRPGLLTGISPSAFDAAPPHTETAQPARAPGQRARHYAPRKPVTLVAPGDATDAPATGRISWHGQTPEQYGARLYADLRARDADPSVTRIWIELPPQTPEWAAIHDRLRRAAAPPGE